MVVAAVPRRRKKNRASPPKRRRPSVPTLGRGHCDSPSAADNLFHGVRDLRLTQARSPGKANSTLTHYSQRTIAIGRKALALNREHSFLCVSAPLREPFPLAEGQPPQTENHFPQTFRRKWPLALLTSNLQRRTLFENLLDVAPPRVSGTCAADARQGIEASPLRTAFCRLPTEVSPQKWRLNLILPAS